MYEKLVCMLPRIPPSTATSDVPKLIIIGFVGTCISINVAMCVLLCMAFHVCTPIYHHSHTYRRIYIYTHIAIAIFTCICKSKTARYTFFFQDRGKAQARAGSPSSPGVGVTKHSPPCGDVSKGGPGERGLSCTAQDEINQKGPWEQKYSA